MVTTHDFGLFVSGALTAGYWIAALFFLRFWRQSKDRLFARFSGAFFLLGVQRIALTGAAELLSPSTVMLWPFLVRLIAFALILWAIIQKNRGR
jgi:membrane-associated PAP2 superfamily phosphatase